MQILKTIEELRAFRASARGSVGFVPTMGALHEGHASLISRAASENDTVIVSVFVNPAQFLPGEDYEKYPRDEAHDAAICRANGASAVFFPTPEMMYKEEGPKVLAPKNLASKLEGATRPGHFDGVCTVLTKFFNLVRPTRAYFGKKDAQQLVIVQNMVRNLFVPIEIVPCEIVREADGLAKSSRNAYLDEAELMNATKLSRSLTKASNLISAGEKSADIIKNAMKECLEPLKIDYIAIVNREFEPIAEVKEGNTIILVAVFMGKTRLIDNVWL